MEDEDLYLVLPKKIKCNAKGYCVHQEPVPASKTKLCTLIHLKCNQGKVL